jgi:hypothetical protein
MQSRAKNRKGLVDGTREEIDDAGWLVRGLRLCYLCRRREELQGDGGIFEAKRRFPGSVYTSLHLHSL